jgi:hypothetical protein
MKQQKATVVTSAPVIAIAAAGAVLGITGLVVSLAVPKPPPAATLDGVEARALSLGLEVRRSGPPHAMQPRLVVIDRGR